MSEKEVRNRAPAEAINLQNKSDADLQPDYVLVFSGDPKTVTVNVQKSLAALADAGFYVAVRHGAAGSVLVLVRLIKLTLVGRAQEVYNSLPWAKLIGVSESYPGRTSKQPKIPFGERGVSDATIAELTTAYGSKTALAYGFGCDLYVSLMGVCLQGLWYWYRDDAFSLTYNLYVLAMGTVLAAKWNSRVLATNAQTIANESADLVAAPKRVGYKNTSDSTRARRRVLFIPVAVSLLALYSLGQIAVLALEVFCTQMYAGPLLPIIKMVPVGANIAASIVFHIINNLVVDKYTGWEDYPTEFEAQEAKTQRSFYLDALLAYLPIVLTAYLYLPFGNLLVGVFPSIQLSVVGRTVPLVSYFKLNTQRLMDQTGFYTLQQPLVNIAMGVVVPRAMYFVKRTVLKQIKTVNDNRFATEQLLAPFDADEEFKALILVFGYVLMLTPVWPLGTAVITAALIIRSKIVLYNLTKWSRQPSTEPSRKASASGLLLWAKNLKFVLVLGSVIGSTLCLMYGNYNPARVANAAGLSYYYDYYTSAMRVPWAHVFAAAFISENLVVAVYNVVSSYLSATDTNPIGKIFTSSEKASVEPSRADVEQQELWKNIDIVKDLSAVFDLKKLQ